MPANPSTTEIELDKVRYLKFDHNACADLDTAMIREMGVSLYDAFQKDADDNTPPPVMIGIGATRLMVWAGLKWAIERISIRRAGEMIRVATMERNVSLIEITGQCIQAVVNSGLFGDPDKLKDALEETEGEEKKAMTGSPENKIPEPLPAI